MSEISELAKAYTAFFAEITNAVKNSKNPFFGNDYADLASVLATVRPVLARHGLAVYQAPGKITPLTYSPGLESSAAAGSAVYAVSVLSVLMHSSGQSINVETQVPIAPNVDKKTGAIKPIDATRAGSAITYARRYALAAICGITQQDDDGAATVVDAVDPALLLRSIEGAQSVADLEALKERVRQAGDKDVADAYIAKARLLKGRA